MCKTTVINIHDYGKYDVFIGRTSIWGNPYSHKSGTLAKFKTKTRKESIDKYEEYIRNSPELISKLPELHNKTLGCFCKPLSCHGDILIKLLYEFYPELIDKN